MRATDKLDVGTQGQCMTALSGLTDALSSLGISTPTFLDSIAAHEEGLVGDLLASVRWLVRWVFQPEFTRNNQSRLP